ncbi:N-terminal domain of NEFA-interacting nuclear protein NIP30-domain-containing protein [Parasitella parasitica]|nr:N-terminal domain of NEFA-interacting nuclear protein NIP30-domain-containing protein [Parasitella parasitica]
MSFNIKSSFVSRAVVEDDEEKQLETETNAKEVVVQEHYDPRTLYERLQEQKTLKEEKFAEESRLSNQIKRVDEEEAEYFRTLSDEKEKLEHQRKVKETLELEEYRQAVESARSNPTPQIPLLDTAATTSTKPKPAIKPSNTKRNSLKGALLIKKKRDAGEDEQEVDEKPADKKQKTENNSLSLLSAYGDISSSDSESE